MLPFPPNELVACKSFVSRRIVWWTTATICGSRETGLIRADRRIIRYEKRRGISHPRAPTLGHPRFSSADVNGSLSFSRRFELVFSGAL